MRHKLTYNLGLKLISLLVACFIWILVTNSNDPESTQGYKNVPITIKNQETVTNANKTFTVVDGIDKITVYVTGRKSLRSKLSASSFTVKADMENYNEALGTVPLEITCNDMRLSQENIRMIPSSLKIKMEDKVEDSFGVVVTTYGKAEKGYELGRASIQSGDTIRIAGPQSLLKIIGKVSVAVDISQMTSDSVERYVVTIEDKNGALLTEGQMNNLELKDAKGVSLQDNMLDVYTEIWPVYGEIPVEVNIMGEPAQGYRVASVTLTPKSVNLVAAKGALEELNGVLTLKDSISVEGLTESKEYTLDMNETLAKYDRIRLEADTVSTITVKVEIDVVGSKVFNIPISDIDMKNVPKDKKLIFSPADYLPVSVKTSDASMKDISEKDIKAEIDLKNCEINGSYTLPVKVSLPDHYELVSDVTIVVNIEDIEKEAEAEAEADMEE